MGLVKCKPPCLHALFSSAANYRLTFKDFFQAAFFLMNLQRMRICLPGEVFKKGRYFLRGLKSEAGSARLVRNRTCKCDFSAAGQHFSQECMKQAALTTTHLNDQ